MSRCRRTLQVVAEAGLRTRHQDDGVRPVRPPTVPPHGSQQKRPFFKQTEAQIRVGDVVKVIVGVERWLGPSADFLDLGSVWGPI